MLEEKALTFSLPNPRAATSVAIKMGDLPVLNSETATNQSVENIKYVIQKIIFTVQNPISFLLRFIAMNAQRWPTFPTHVTSQFIGLPFSFDENQCLRICIARQFANQFQKSEKKMKNWITFQEYKNVMQKAFFKQAKRF